MHLVGLRIGDGTYNSSFFLAHCLSFLSLGIGHKIIPYNERSCVEKIRHQWFEPRGWHVISMHTVLVIKLRFRQRPSSSKGLGRRLLI